MHSVYITKEAAKELVKRGIAIEVSPHTLRHEEHREALSETMARKFKMKKKRARDFVEQVAEESGLKQ